MGSLGTAGTAADLFLVLPVPSVREECFVRRSSLTRGEGTAVMTVLLCTVAIVCGFGCTMCPAPFDYSGTVPGAADQNDFRVRNNGILPIWKRPRPWPPVVSNKEVEDDNGRNEPTPKASRLIAAASKKLSPDEEATSILATDQNDSSVTLAGHAATEDPDSSGLSVAGFFKDSIPKPAITPAE